MFTNDYSSGGYTIILHSNKYTAWQDDEKPRGFARGVSWEMGSNKNGRNVAAIYTWEPQILFMHTAICPAECIVLLNPFPVCIRLLDKRMVFFILVIS